LLLQCVVYGGNAHFESICTQRFHEQPTGIIKHLLFIPVLRRSIMAEAPRITVSEVKKRTDAGETFTFIDTRNPQAFSESDSTLPGAIHLSLDQLDEKLKSIPKNKSVVTYCT